MKRIIVNADDFGINRVVTSEIERQIMAGRVSSTTVMANGACLDEVKLFAVKHPEASYGVHLCLSEFDSLTKSEGLWRAGLTDEKGAFNHRAVFGQNNFSSEAMQAIREELNAQIDTVAALGFPISHADSHHHVHTIYALKDVFSEVLHSRGIKRVRLGAGFHNIRMKIHLSLWLQRNRLNNYYKSHFVTTDIFYSYSDFLEAKYPLAEGRTVELMCHPGHPGKKYVSEIQKMEECFFSTDFKLISYNDLQ